VNIAGAATALALAGTTGTTTIRNNLTVTGNITYGGGANQLSATNLSVDDALIYLAANNSVADIIDIGIVGRYNNGVNNDTHTGLVRDATDKSWKLFSGITTEPTTVVDFTSATYDNLKIGGLTASTGVFSGQITSNIATGTAPFVITSTTPVANLNIGGYSSALKSATTIIDVSAAEAPSNGKVLTATSATTAEWKDPVGGGGTGTVITVGGTGSVNGITLSGTVTSSGNLTLGGTLSNVSLTTAVTGTLPVANGGTGVTTSTGSGNNVLSTSPTLVTPILGTPTSGTLTSCTGLPLTTGVTGILPVANGGTGVTTLTGLIKGTGASAFTAATSGVDYVEPSTINGISGRVSDTDGNLRSIPQSNKTAAYQLTAADNGKNINITTGGITIPSSVFAAGDVISIYNASDATQSIAWSGPSVYVAGTAGVKTSPLTLAARGILTIMFATTTDIVASGNV
jgi:hypothetical protein